MNLIKKILVVHGNSSQRRQLVLLLAGAGFDIRAFGSIETAAEGASQEWFDLALVAHDLAGTQGFTFVSSLRKVQPTVPVIMLVDEVEFPLVVQGIRQGVADVLPQNQDLLPIIRRVCAFFNHVPSSDQEVSSEDLAKAEAILDILGGVGDLRRAAVTDVSEPSSQLLQAAKDKAALETQLERAVRERSAIEAQLKALLAQNSDLGKLSAEAAELRSQREIVAAAQNAIDGKARELAAQRAEIERERDLLHSEKQQLETRRQQKSSEDADFALKAAEISEEKVRLDRQSRELRAEATRIQQEHARLASERRRWHSDLDILRDQEENLRHYESRLREWQAHLEAEKVRLIGAQQAAPATPENDESLKVAWNKYYRATQLLEADKANFVADKLAIKDLEKALRLRETTVGLREAKVADAERRLREAAESARAAVAPKQAPESGSSLFFNSFTRSPFATAKAILGTKRNSD